MHTHNWFYQGKIIKIIDGNAIIIWIDLGFETWKKVLIRFNRIRAKEDSEAAYTIQYLEQNLKGKAAYFQIFKKKVYEGFNKYFAEVYVKSGDITLKLGDLNRCFNSPHKLDGYININDVLIGQGLATLLTFSKDNHAQDNLHNRPPRKYPAIRSNPGNSAGAGNQTDSSRGGFAPEGQRNI